MFDFSIKSDQEQYEFMIKKSFDARECERTWKEQKQFEHASHIIELVKIGYTREEIYSFLRVVYGV